MKLRSVQDDFVDVLDRLSDGSIKTAVRQAITGLKQDKILGEHIKKKQIPKYYITRHNIPILYWWNIVRMFYNWSIYNQNILCNAFSAFSILHI